MLVSAQAKYIDYSARSLDRRISRVGDRAEEERRKNQRRRPHLEADKALAAEQVLLPFAARPAPSSGATLQATAALSADALWTLIDAVDGTTTSQPSSTVEPVAPVSPVSQAESLYLLLAQVIGDDLDEGDATSDALGSHI